MVEVCCGFISCHGYRRFTEGLQLRSVTQFDRQDVLANVWTWAHDMKHKLHVVHGVVTGRKCSRRLSADSHRGGGVSTFSKNVLGNNIIMGLHLDEYKYRIVYHMQIEGWGYSFAWNGSL